MSTSNERLFIDWAHVQKGTLEMTLDPAWDPVLGKYVAYLRDHACAAPRSKP